MRFIGIDLHNDNLLAIFIDKNGDASSKCTVDLCDQKKFEEFRKSLTNEDYAAFETTTNSFWLYDQIKNLVKEAFVVNTHKFSGKKRKSKKTDYQDACKIAERLRYFITFNRSEELFPIVYVPEKEVQELRSMFSTYTLLLKQKTMNKNRIRSLLVQQGIYLKGVNIWTDVMKEKIVNMEMAVSAKYQITLLQNQIDDLENQLEKLKAAILVNGQYFEKEIELITSIKGISVFTAIAIMTDIATVDRFETAKKMCSYLRSAPSINESNETTKMGPVNKQSRKLALTMLVQGIHHAYRSSAYLFNIFNRIKSKKKAGKARVAIARKIFEAIYYMLKKGEYFYWTHKDNHEKKMNQYKKFLQKKEKLGKTA